MRKLMALAVGLILAGASTLYAMEGLGAIKLDGSLEVSGDAADNEVDYNDAQIDHRGNTATRTRLGINVELTEDALGRVELVRTPATAGTDAMYGGQNKPSSVADEEGYFLIHNAYVELSNLWGLKARLGRQYYGNPDDLVLYYGPLNDDSLTVNSIDGLLLQSRHWDKLDVDLFVGKIQENGGVANTDATAGNGDVNLNDLEATLKLIPELNVRAGYILADQKNTNATNDNNTLIIYRVGANGSLLENLVTYRAEYLQNAGENGRDANKIKYKGNAIDLGVGYNSPDLGVGKVGAWINYAKGSGDKNSTDNKDKSFRDLSPGRMYGEIFGKSPVILGGDPGLGLDPSTGTMRLGLQVFNIGAKFVPTSLEKLSVKLDYFLLSRAEEKLNGVKMGDKFGSEVDLTLGWAQTNNIGLEAGYAMLSPDDALTGMGAVNDDAVTKLFGRVNVKWGGEEEK
ncbi:MAG: alginate export family protein [Elusimicrobia bacterium]|nr:alginate export family protein [Candidatus Obscuribacterium magneticum]MCB4755483.1 alginate export family protein [Candidatus Obscuribacterium magneticum]